MISWAAFGGWLKGVPQWVWMAALAALGIYLIRRDGYRDGHKEAAHTIEDEIEEQTDERIKRVEKERRATADLNDAERLRLAAESKHNRGRLQRPPPD